jgi:hypothetical protein
MTFFARVYMRFLKILSFEIDLAESDVIPLVILFWKGAEIFSKLRPFPHACCKILLPQRTGFGNAIGNSAQSSSSGFSSTLWQRLAKAQ